MNSSNVTGDRFDFSHYYTYSELVNTLQVLESAYPHLLSLEAIGKSYEGRDLWLAILTDRETGNRLEKPGYWIDANTHAGEVTGSAVALYIIDRLLTQYQQDDQVTRLLENYTVYILPRLAVDGAEKYLTTPDSLRSSVRHYPEFDQRDGLVPEDLNGDGLILEMRIKDECGAWKVSELDRRIMVHREPEEFGGTYYTLLPEGLIHNYDGYKIELAPPLFGLDFNRNYPYQWAREGEQKGAGDFPLSEPETRAEAEFWHQHPHINGFLTYHTYGGVILRPYSTDPDDHFPSEDLEIYQLIGEKGTALTGYDCISIYHDFRHNPQQVTNGAMDDYGYDHFGWFGFTIELWDPAVAAGIEKKDYVSWYRFRPVADELKLMRWNDEKLGGAGFIDWQPFEHPQLGAVEIGGWNLKRFWHNAPAEYLPELCEKHCRFAIAHALMSPRLAVARTAVTYQGSNIYRVVVQLENQGFLPTYTSKKAQERHRVKPIEVSLSLPAGASLIGGQLKQAVGHLEGRSNKAKKNLAQGFDYRCQLEWVLKAPSGSELQIVALSERAGTVRTLLTLQPEN